MTSVSKASDRLRLQAREACQTDPDLLPHEQEFAIHTSKGDRLAAVQSDITSVTARLLTHPHFQVAHVRMSDEDRFGARLSLQEWQESGGAVTGVEGYIPVACLKVGSSKRTENWHSLIVSDYTPEGA